MQYLQLIFLIFLANMAFGQECQPEQSRDKKEGRDDVAPMPSLKSGTHPWREHPDGMHIDEGVTNADLGFLMSTVLLKCGEYVSAVRLENGLLSVFIEAQYHRGKHGFSFKKDEDGYWRSKSVFTIS